MTDDSGTHIASDEEILSRYALGRLDGAEREKVDRHIAGCPACMEALRREMRIAAGVRRLGRENLKERLRVAAGPHLSRWPRILSVAAAVTAVAGLGAYYAWFNGGETLPPRSGESPPLAGRTESPGQDEGNAPAREPADKVKGDRTVGSPAQSSGHLQANRNELASPASRDAENGRRGTAGAGDIAASEAARGMPSTEPAGAFWSDGVVQRGKAALDAAAPRPEKGAVLSQEKSAVLSKSTARKEEEGRLKDALPPPRAHYLLRQQPASALPADRERSGKEQQNVPTRVDQRGSTTTMTMYLDSLVDEKDLKKARVEALGDDSVVVMLGGKKILYRFPPGQGAQQQRQK
jgi:anti-sigma factor RsiW